MPTLLTTTALILAASAASAENICYQQMNPLDYQCRYDEARNRCTCQALHGDRDRPHRSPISDPGPGPRPDTKPTVEPDRRTDPEGWQHWRDNTPRGNGHNSSQHTGSANGEGHGERRENGERK